MKEVRGIRTFSVCTIILGSVVSLVLFSAWLQPGGLASNREINLMLTAVLLSLLTLGYPALLLLIRDRYYRHFPISYRARVFTHIFRVIQLIFIVLLTGLLTVAIYNVSGKFNAGNSFRLNVIQSGTLLILLVTIVLNLTLFFKGWRLLKQTRKPYIDEVMSTFDPANLPQQQLPPKSTGQH
ncbi:MAG: hypothetical protein J0H74_35580 [Chitinophagaceae bacterium]|nr:hypothetical protein [Chitinophagaceae bacterium]